MVSALRIGTVATAAAALVVWTTGCERHQWSGDPHSGGSVSELYKGHHGAHHAEDGEAHAQPGQAHAEGKENAGAAGHAAPAHAPKPEHH
jgi:hypothetical protein